MTHLFLMQDIWSFKGVALQSYQLHTAQYGHLIAFSYIQISLAFS